MTPTLCCDVCIQIYKSLYSDLSAVDLLRHTAMQAQCNTDHYTYRLLQHNPFFQETVLTASPVYQKRCRLQSCGTRHVEFGRQVPANWAKLSHFLRPEWPPILGEPGALSLRVKRQGHEADHSHLVSRSRKMEL
jgi:hypothetical protein